MNDIDFDELDRAVSNTLSGKKGSKPAASSSDSSLDVEKKDDNNTTPAASPPTQEPANKTSEESKAKAADKDSDNEKKPTTSDAPAGSLIKPRTSINRAPQSAAANKGGAVDIVAPSKKSSHSGAIVSPIRPGIELQSSGAKADTTKDSAPDQPAKPETDSEKAPGAASAAQTVPELSSPSPETSSESTASKTEHKGDTGSFERFESLSRSGYDFDMGRPAEEAKASEKPVDSGHDLDTTKETDIEPAEKDSKEDSEAEESIADKELPKKETEKEDKDEKDEAEDTKPASSSPFLSDTKVEKRPLGSYAGQAASNTPKDTDESVKTETETKEPAAEEAAKPLETETKPDSEEKTKNDGKPREENPTHDNEEKIEVKAEAKESHSVALGSIPQQYKTAAAEQKENGSHPVFDTKEYHAPMSDHGRAPDTGSNWFLIIAVIILALAVGAAVAIYLYGSELGLALPEVGKPNTSSL